MTYVGSGVHIGAAVVVTQPVGWAPAELAPTVWLAAGVGLTGATPVTAWANQGSHGGTFASGAGPDAVAGGCDFDAGEYLVSNIPLASTHYTHDGTGFSFWAHVSQGSSPGSLVLIDTNSASTTNLGFSILVDQDFERLKVRIGNGSAIVFNVNTPIGSCLNNADHLIEWYFLEDMGSNHIYRIVVDGVVVLEQLTVTANAPSSGDALYSLTLCGRASAPTTLTFDGVVKALGMVNRILSASEIADLRGYYLGFEQAPAAAADLRLWLDAHDLTIGTVTTWADRSGYGNHATAVGSPTMATDWSGGTKPCVTTNGTTQYITADGIGSLISGDDKPFSISMVYRLVTTAAYKGIWAFNRTASSASMAEMYGGISAGTPYTRVNRDDASVTASRTAGDISTAKQIHVGVDTGTTFTSWFNGLKKHDAVNVNVGPKTLDLFSVGCLRRGGVVSDLASLQLCEVLVWNRALTADEVASEQARLTAKWSVPAPAGGLHRWSVENRVQDGYNITALVDMVGSDDAVQATGTKQPTISLTGGPRGGPSVLFDGIDDYLSKAFTLAQPYAVVTVCKAIDAAGTMVDGTAINTGRIYYSGGAFRIYAGASGAGLISTTVTNWHVVSAAFDGASSFLTVDGATGTVGNAGTLVPGGVTIGIVGDHTSDPANAHIVEVVYCTLASRAAWVAYLNAKYGIF